MRHVIPVIFSFIFFNAATAQYTYWQQQVNYKIDVTLNDKGHELDGYEKIEYLNNSPDTLHYIWFHLWANAYKNDKTAFSDQRLENGNTDFYFSGNDKRGYINRLGFKVNGSVALMEDHPQHQDIIKIVLPSPLAPKSSCKIETAFHVKLPFNFSRGGHKGQSYQITQWYPKPAVYDRKGWHPFPYLDQGEFYSEFGNYEVQITLPAAYVVAATGEVMKDSREATSTNIRTIIYKQNNVHDFAWFADKNFIVKQDTILLKSGRVINVFAYLLNKKNEAGVWKNATTFIRKAVSTRSELLGEYPYQNVSVVDADVDYAGGMEYPMITAISGVRTEKELEQLTEHEAGHNWNYGILASNEREHPWMDEGMNTYYGTRYWNGERDINVRERPGNKFLSDRMPVNMNIFLLNNVIAAKKDQPIETVSEKLSALNYDMSAYHKASRWMKLLENTLGTALFDSCMKEYFNRWKFRHPYPEDFKKVMEGVSGKNLDNEFALLNKKGSLPGADIKREKKFAPFFNFKDTDKYKYIFAFPVAGFNMYDKLMLGAAIHNYTLPAEKFQFLAIPLYSTAAKQLNGLGRLGYHWYPDKHFQKIEIGFNGSRFSSNHSLDTTGKKIFESFYKVVPYLKFWLHTGNRSNTSTWIDIRSYIIGEKQFDNFDYIVGSDSSQTYPKSFSNSTRYINQVSFNSDNRRVLYPYSYQLQLQQGKGFYRINLTGNYFFNYSKGGGITARFFAAKFGYMGAIDPGAYQYQPKLLGGNGFDDYTYSNYFSGRTASSANSQPLVKNAGVAAQQVMIQNGGGLKLRLDPYGYVQGQSENWVAAINVSTTLPDKLFPVKIPLKIFFDIGSYAEAWSKNASTSRFLYVGGLQLSLFKEVVTIYAPLIYSSDFRSALKTDSEANKFSKKITFSIDLQKLTLKKFIPQFDF